MTSLTVEVVLALPQRCWRRWVAVAPGATAGEVLERSGLAEVCVREAGQAPALGVFGRKVSPAYVLQPGERLELYRGLLADPRERRRGRARRQGGSKTAG